MQPVAMQDVWTKLFDGLDYLSGIGRLKKRVVVFDGWLGPV